MKKLLIIDDEPGIVEEIKSFFEEEGYEVHTADTAKMGIELIEKLKPALVLLDMKLPDMSGLAVLKMCKASYPWIKVIVNTGYVDQHLIDEAERLGRDAFLTKPFDLTRLKDEIDQLLAPPPPDAA